MNRITLHPVTKFLFIIAMLFTGCGTEEISPVINDTSSSATGITEENGRRKLKSPLTSFSFNDRTYTFNYNDAGELVEITASQNETILYSYVPHYDRRQLISADLIENGKVMSSNTNFDFDKKGNITGYDYVSYFFPEYPNGIAFPYTLVYDKKGNISTMSDNSSLLYDHKDNVVQWGDRRFIFDTKNLNPFYQYEDLWLVFVEEPFLTELMLSPNLMTSQSSADGQVTTYSNVYDSQRRLVTRIATVNGEVTETMHFTYGN